MPHPTRPFALLAALLVTPAAEASASRWTRPPEDPFKIGLEVVGLTGGGLRLGYTFDHRVVDSLNLRVGFAAPMYYWEGSHRRLGGLTPFADLAFADWLTPWLAPALDLNIWGPFEVELTAGWALIGTEQAHLFYNGFIGGAALRLDFETDMPVSFDAGVMVASDTCFCAPRVILDVGPRFTW
ncbi:MAG: hypothetical protein ABIO70_18100 [Pseudomonadota bacterium]